MTLICGSFSKKSLLVVNNSAGAFLFFSGCLIQIFLIVAFSEGVCCNILYNPSPTVPKPKRPITNFLCVSIFKTIKTFMTQVPWSIKRNDQLTDVFMNYLILTKKPIHQPDEPLLPAFNMLSGKYKDSFWKIFFKVFCHKLSNNRLGIAIRGQTLLRLHVSVEPFTLWLRRLLKAQFALYFFLCILNGGRDHAILKRFFVIHAQLPH